MSTVLITGAANGLGRATTELFARQGWNVIATDLSAAETDFSPAERITFVEMDVRSDESVTSAFSAIRKRFDSIDLIINNAGIDRYFPLSETPVGEFRNIFEVNLFGSYRVNHTFLPLLRKPGGRIIHIGSESFRLKLPFMPYPLTKNALEGYAMALRQELKFIGIDVTVIRPGAIDTAILLNVSRLHETEIRGSLGTPFKQFASQAPKEIGKTLSPLQVAGFIYKVSQIRNPKPVYRINNSLQLRLAAWIPFPFMERLVMKRLNN